jgi:hypothetical protein
VCTHSAQPLMRRSHWVSKHHWLRCRHQR